MKDPIISTYWKVFNSMKHSLPSGEDVMKFAYYSGRAANELKKGIRCLRRKKLEKGKINIKPKRIIIE